MIVRGKAAQQVTFLHVSHHAMMGFAWLAVLKYYPQGDAWFGAFANSLVHVFMYGYYCSAAQGRQNGDICGPVDLMLGSCAGRKERFGGFWGLRHDDEGSWRLLWEGRFLWV